MTIVQTIAQATQVAIHLVRKYYSFVYPIAARKENSRSTVDLDISYPDRAKWRVKIPAEPGLLKTAK